MKTLCLVRSTGLVLALLCFCIPPSNAQEKIASLDEIKNQAELDKAITALDTKLFDAYNHCDLKTFDSLLADDVEFYHDQGGVTLGRQNRERQEQHLHRRHAAGACARHSEDLLHERLRSA